MFREARVKGPRIDWGFRVYASAMLCVRVLGELELELDGKPLDPPASRRARSLLGLLALDRRLHARSQLAARFWPDVLDESARTSLRSALTALRRSLGPEPDRYLVTTRERAGLADEVHTDAAEFERLVAAGRLEEALGHWRGELLADLDEDWVLVARDEWRERVAGVLNGLATRAEADGDLAAAVAHTRRIVALEPLGEEGQRALIRRLAAAGDRVAALASYRRYAERLRDELRIAPSAATRALVDGLRRTGSEVEPALEESAPLERDSGGTGAATSATLTLMFTDLVGSTELLDDLGDESAERLRRVHFGLLREVALSHAGQEVKNLGDGLMVAFRSSVDAAACAIGIQQAVDRHNRREQSDRLRVRVGLHVGEPIRDEDDYFGTAIVIAKRLCDRADGDQILVSELVRMLIGSRGGFVFRSVGELALKGFAQLVKTCELEWEPLGEQQIPLPGEFGQEQRALVGRMAELSTLDLEWTEAQRGNLRVVLVGGEPGIGKTRLVAELCRRAHVDGATVLLGRCTEETLVPYQPFVEALAHYVASCPADELVQQLGTRRRLLATLVPELAGTPSGLPSTSEARGEGEGERYALFDAVSSLLREASRTRPTILVLDDLQWADPPSLLLLRHLVRSAHGAPLLILGTYRDTEVLQEDTLATALADLRRARALTSLSLGGLGSEDVAALVRNRGGQLDDEHVRTLAERTEGNPFFVEEVVRNLKGGGELGVPQSVKDLLLRRLRGLGESARRALAAAAVLGSEFELGVLEQVIGSSGEELLEVMEQALAGRVLVESPEAVGRFTFAHALVRETIYEQLSVTRRARLHLRAGEALEALHFDELDARAAQLAHHFAAARDDQRTFEYQVRAAQSAARVFAMASAVAHNLAAFETGVRLGLSPETDTRMRWLLRDRGWTRYAEGDFEAAIADYGRALDAARSAGDRRLEADALDGMAYAEKLFDVDRARAHHRAALEIAEELADSPLQVRILNRLSLVLSNELDLAAALELGERALELARTVGGDRERALAIDALKLVALQLGDLDRLEELTAELAQLERSSGDLWYLQWTLLESSFAPMGRARWEVAADRLDEALAINHHIGSAGALPLIHDARGWLERSRAQYGRALAEGRRAVELARRDRQPVWSSWTRASLGWTLLEVRAVGEAVAVLDLAVADAVLLADRYRAAGHLAWARSLAGDAAGSADAAKLAEQALAEHTIPRDGAFLFGFGASVALARAELANGTPERAEANLVTLLAVAERSGWHEAAASASLVLGLCREARGVRDAAQAAFRHAVNLAGEHGLPGIEWEAVAALARGARGEDAVALRSRSTMIVDRIASGIGEEALAEALRRSVQS
jgi:class 3 adenylate cyclase/tetratricopeptide (TPR) repeat protein